MTEEITPLQRCLKLWTMLEKPELYHLERAISEAYDGAGQHPEIVERLLAVMKEHEADIDPHEDMLAIPLQK